MSRHILLPVWVVLAGVVGVGLGLSSVVTPAEGKTIIRFAVWGTQSEVDTYREIITRFEKLHPDIGVKYESTDWGGYWAKIPTEVASGMPPDVMRMSPAYLAKYAGDGALADLQPLIERDRLPIETDYFDTMGLFKWNGHYYGLPDGGSMAGLYYNADAFDQAGLGYPTSTWTWEDLRVAAGKLTIRQANAVRRYGLQVSFWADGETGYRSFILQAGTNLLNLEKTRAAVDSPEAMAAVEYLVNMVQHDRSLVPPSWAPSWWSGAAVDGFNQEAFAIITGLVPTWIKQVGQAKFRWDIAPLPVGKRRAAVANYVGFSMSSSTKVKEAAWTLLRFITGPEGQAVLARNRQMLPPLKSAALSQEFLAPEEPPYRLREVITVTAPYTYDLQFTPGWDKWTMAVGQEVSAAADGRKSVAAAMRTAAERVNGILKSFGVSRARG